MHLRHPQVDVLINVFGKPWQTSLSLLSLLRFSGEHVGAIYFQEEPCTAEYERKDHSAILHALGDRIIHYKSKYWLGIGLVDQKKLEKDAEYRRSIRYQYGWEESRADYALVIHNDIRVKRDVVGALLDNIHDAVGVGEIGQCWWCPAGQGGLCSPERYTEYAPKYHQLMHVYNMGMDYTKRRAYNLGLNASFWEKPWPLPECRLNEWCALIDMKRARGATRPFGGAAPYGACYPSGSKIGEDWE